MGKPGTSHVVSSAPEHIGCVEGTPGSETSQYRQEEKTNSDSVSSGERKRIEPKPCMCDSCQALHAGGCGTCLTVLTPVEELQSHSLVERCGKAGRRG